MIMDKLPKQKGVYYISKCGGSSADCAFFAEGLVMRRDDFRVATEEEVQARSMYEEARRNFKNSVV